MKYCSQCDREFGDGSVFCPQCGQPLTVLPAAEAPVSEPPPASAGVPEAPEEPAAPAAEELAEASAAVAAEAPVTLLEPEAAPPAVLEPPAEQPSPAAEAPAVEKAEKRDKKKKRVRVEPKIGFFRHLLAFLLCILLFVFLLVPALIYEVRDTTTERWIGAFLEKVELSDYIDTGALERGIGNWLYDQVPAAARYVRIDLSGVGGAVDDFIDRSTLRPFLAGQFGTFFGDVYAGTTTDLLTAEDFEGFLADNGDLFNELANGLLDAHLRASLYIDFRLSDADRAALADVLAEMLTYAGLRDYLSADGFRREMPEAYYGMRFGLSWVTLGVSLVLALLVFLALIKVLKSGTRAINRLGIVLVIIGLGLALIAFFPKAVPSLWYAWMSLFQSEYLIALLASEFFFTHIVFIDLILLGAGVLLIALVALIRGGKRRRLEKAART